MSEHASLTRRLAACVYELLSLLAIWFFCTFLFVMLQGPVDTGTERLMLQFVLWLIAGVYLSVCWVRTGQTLAAQAWKIKVVDADYNLLTARKALIRSVLATVSLLCFGLGFLWAVIDKEHLFLHDRLGKTRLIKLSV